MRENIAVIVLFAFVLSYSTTAHNNGKKQIDVLNQLYMSKLRGIAKVERRPFNASIHFDEAELHGHEGDREKDLIESLPGQPHVRFKQYAGYVTVNRTAGRAFFYYFVESHKSSSSSPLLLWLNGGPGCSSIGYGAMEEIGPFRVHSDGKTLYKNHFSWNHAANVLFLESPAGVGFSYSNTWTDLEHNSGDRRTARDNYVFLLKWLQRFPEYKNRELYVSGESYAGHYVPQLAQTILHHNKTIINLKGIIIGNPVINDESDAKGMYEYFESHGLISKQTLNRILRNCDFRDNGRGMSTQCFLGLLETERNTAALDIYNIYAPTCSHNTTKTNTHKATDPCIDQYVHAYLNRAEVQNALHANITKIPYDWQPCSNVIGKWQDSPSTVIPLLKDFVASGLRVWIYSSTKLSIQLMKLVPSTPWLPWYLEDQVGGYTQVYKGNLTFATVRGAGHEVPSFQPARALLLINHFLQGKQLPTTRNITLFS